MFDDDVNFVHCDFKHIVLREKLNASQAASALRKEVEMADTPSAKKLDIN